MRPPDDEHSKLGQRRSARGGPWGTCRCPRCMRNPGHLLASKLAILKMMSGTISAMARRAGSFSPIRSSRTSNEHLSLTWVNSPVNPGPPEAARHCLAVKSGRDGMKSLLPSAEHFPRSAQQLRLVATSSVREHSPEGRGSRSAVPWRTSWNTEHQLSLRASRSHSSAETLEERAPRRGGLWHLNSEHPERDRIQTSEGTVGSPARQLPADCSLRGPSIAVGRSPRTIHSAKLHAFLDCRIGGFTRWSVAAISVRPWPPRW